MIIYVDVISGKEIGSDSYPEKEEPAGILQLETKKVKLGDEDGGVAANVDEDADEGATAEEGDKSVKEVINLVHSHQLVLVDLDKKTFQSLMKGYWKLLTKKLMSAYYVALGFEEDYEVEDAKEFKKAETDALKKLKKAEKEAAEAAKQAVKTFKGRLDELKKFVSDVILKNWDEFQFYIPPDTEMDACHIIPARYIGDATSPIIYLFKDGINQVKA